jgi:hypothetical protein
MEIAGEQSAALRNTKLTPHSFSRRLPMSAPRGPRRYARTLGSWTTPSRNQCSATLTVADGGDSVAIQFSWESPPSAADRDFYYEALREAVELAQDELDERKAIHDACLDLWAEGAIALVQILASGERLWTAAPGGSPEPPQSGPPPPRVGASTPPAPEPTPDPRDARDLLSARTGMTRNGTDAPKIFLPPETSR